MLCFEIPPVELSKAELHVEERQATKDQHCEVGYKEGPLEVVSKANQKLKKFSPPPLA